MLILKLIRIILGEIIIALDFLIPVKRKKRSVAEQNDVNNTLNAYALYEFRRCPFCVKVRRHMRRLNIDIERRDALKNKIHEQDLINQGGKRKVPCLRIEKEGKVEWLYDSKVIKTYLSSQFA